MLSWEVGVFTWPRIPPGPPGHWPPDGPGVTLAALCRVRPVAVFVSRPFPLCRVGEHGVGVCLLNLIPLEHLKGILSPPPPS